MEEYIILYLFVVCKRVVCTRMGHEPKQPNGALRLVEALARTAPLHRLDLDALCLKHPAEVVDLVLREGDPGDLSIHHIAHRLDQQRLLALIEKYFATLEYHSHWLPTFKPETRLALYTSFSALWRDHRGCLSADLVALLPRTQREQEGRRHLALSALATHPEKRLPYAAFLPWDEAYHLLEPFLHDPSQNTRVLVLQTLTQAVQYERHRLPDLLTLVCTHLNEPDPVRGQIVNALAELPQSIWRLEHLEELESITRCIIDAFDTSSFTVGALLFLLLRVLACAPEWSAAHMALVTQKYGLVLYADRRKYLTEQVVRQIGPALRPVLISWAEQGDEQKLQPLIALFGKRVRVFEVLLDALEVALKHHPSAHFGNTILATFRKHSPERMAHVIPQLLQKGEGKILYPEILTYMFRYRQDLLTPLFAGQLQTVRIPSPNGKSQARQKGRRKRRFRVSGYPGWTAHQQALVVQKLLEIINNESSDPPSIISAITRLAALPAVPSTHLIALANDPRPVVRDTALMQLAKLDNGEGIAALQDALRDWRAVRALYALRPWFVTAPTQQALAVLRSIPLTKVTLAKEVVRVLGELPGEEAYQELLAWERQELHRNVRIVLLRALWSHLEREETWQILEREAQSPDMTIALSTARLSLSPALAKVSHTRKRFRRWRKQPATLHQIFRFSEWNTMTLAHLSGEQLVVQAQQRLMHLYALLLQRPEMEVRAAVLRDCMRLAAADEGQALLAQLLAALDSEHEDLCTAAASAIFGTCIASDAPLIGQAIQRLLSNRAALQTVLHAIRPELPNQSQLLPVVRAVSAALAIDPLTIKLRLGLVMTFLPWEEVASLLREGAASGILHADALAHACHTLSAVLGRYGRPGRSDGAELVQLEEALAAHPDEYLRRIALAALLTQAELPPGWSEERRARLQVYRADPSPLVAAAAQFTVLPSAEV